MSVPGKAIYKFNAIPAKIPVNFFFLAEVENSILKFIRNLKGPQIAKNSLVKEEHSWSSQLTVIRTNYKATVIKTVSKQGTWVIQAS